MNLNKIKQKTIEYEKAVVSSLKIYFDAHQFIRKNNFRKYLLISGLGFLLLFTVTIKLVLYGIDYIESPITQWILPFLEQVLTLSADDIAKGVKAVFWLIKKAIESNSDAIFSAIFLIIGTPFFSFISSKTEEIKTAKKYEFKFNTFIKEIKRGLQISIRNSIKQFGLVLLITLLALIPGVSIVSPLLIFIIQAYYNGIIMTDYTLERQDYSVKESEGFYKLHKPEMFAIGLGFMFLLLIPVIGWFMAPTYGLVASYLYFSKIEAK